MNRFHHIFLVFAIGASISILSCQQAADKNPDQLKQEITQTEKAFAKMALEEGLQKAFLHFADENAVLMRNNQVIEGKVAIQAWFENRPPASGILDWAPDFVEVSASGDLGYTYGKYTYSVTDSTGQQNQSSGIFHTVWKRQEDGSWKYVWD